MSDEILLKQNEDGTWSQYEKSYCTVDFQTKEDYERLKQIVEKYRKLSWIPIEEKTPENDQYVLVSFTNFSMPDIARYSEEDGGGAFYPGDDDKTYSEYGIFVNAWMPLPEPYEEGEE